MCCWVALSAVAAAVCDAHALQATLSILRGRTLAPSPVECLYCVLKLVEGGEQLFATGLFKVATIVSSSKKHNEACQVVSRCLFER
jgi:hypothetical protein